MDKSKSFTRQELQELRTRASYMKDVTLSVDWKAAYAALALAVDHLDAMIARTEVSMSENR